jgi:hypothetical protein
MRQKGLYLQGVLSGYEGHWIIYSDGRHDALPRLVAHARRLRKADPMIRQVVVRAVDCVVVWPKSVRGLALGSVCPKAITWPDYGPAYGGRNEAF